MLLVRVAGAADAAAEVHARALLDDVRHRMQVGATIQDDVIARRLRPGAHLAGARGCVMPRVRAALAELGRAHQSPTHCQRGEPPPSQARAIGPGICRAIARRQQIPTFACGGG